MKTYTPVKVVICLILAVVMSLTATGLFCARCFADAPAEAESPKVIYEAFFLDNAEIADLFAQTRGEEAPHAIMTKDFHVTTSFMPEQDMRELYGTEVTIHIYAYQDGQIPADDGSMTANEGFFCTITAENEQMQAHINALDNNWHITGSYQDQGGAKYTGRLDLEGAQMVEYVVTGRFGAFLSDNSLAFAQDVLN